MQLSSIQNYEDFSKIIEKYAESLRSQIIISRKNFAELIIKSFKYATANYKIQTYFLFVYK